MFDIDDVEPFELAHRFAHGRTRSAHGLAQFDLRRQQIARLEPLPQNIRFDRVHRHIAAAAHRRPLLQRTGLQPHDRVLLTAHCGSSKNHRTAPSRRPTTVTHTDLTRGRRRPRPHHPRSLSATPQQGHTGRSTLTAPDRRFTHQHRPAPSHRQPRSRALRGHPHAHRTGTKLSRTTRVVEMNVW